MGRHTGEAFELVLDPVVPQLGRDLAEQTSQELVCLIFETLEQVEREQLKSGSRSSPNKMGEEEEEEKEEEEEAAQNFLLYLLPVQGEEPGCGGVRGGRGGRGHDRVRTA